MKAHSYRVADLLRHPSQGMGIVRAVDGWMVWIECAGPDLSYLGWNAGERLAEWSLYRRADAPLECAAPYSEHE